MSTQVQLLLNVQETTNPGSLPLVPCQLPPIPSQPLQPRSVTSPSSISQPVCPPGPASLDSSSVDHPPIPSAGPSIPVASQTVKGDPAHVDGPHAQPQHDADARPAPAQEQSIAPQARPDQQDAQNEASDKRSTVIEHSQLAAQDQPLPQPHGPYLQANAHQASRWLAPDGHPDELLGRRPRPLSPSEWTCSAARALQHIQGSLQSTSRKVDTEKRMAPPTDSAQQPRQRPLTSQLQMPPPSLDKVHRPPTRQQSTQLLVPRTPKTPTRASTAYVIYDIDTCEGLYINLDQIVQRENLAEPYQKTIDGLRHDLAVSKKYFAYSQTTVDTLRTMLAQSRAKADSLQPSKLASEVIKQAETIDALNKNMASWQTALRSRDAIIVEMHKSIVSQAASNSMAIAKVRWLEERVRTAHEDMRLRVQYLSSMKLHIQAAEGAIQGSVGSASADRSMLEDLSTSRTIAANVTGPSSVSIVELAESDSAASGTQIEDSGPKTTTEQPAGMGLIKYHHSFADVDFVTPPNPTHTSSGSESYTDPDSVTTSWTEASFEFEFDESSAATSSPAFQATVEVLHHPITNEGSGTVPALVSEVPGETSQKRARESDTPEPSRKLFKSGSNPEVHVESVVASSSSPLGTEVESASTAPTSSPEVGETLVQIGHTFIADAKKAAERLSLLVDSADKFNFLFFETTALVNFLNAEILRKSSVLKTLDLAGRDAVRADGKRLVELHRLIGETKTIFQAATR